MDLGRVGLWTFQLDLQRSPAAARDRRRARVAGLPHAVGPRRGGPGPAREQRPAAVGDRADGAGHGRGQHLGTGRRWPCAPASSRVAEAYPDRFLLGLGVSHQPMVDFVRGGTYDKPLTAMREYLEKPWTPPSTWRPARPRSRAACSPRSAPRCCSSPPTRPWAPTPTSCRSSTPPSHARCSATDRCSAPSRRSCSRPTPTRRARRRPGSTWRPTSGSRTTPTTCAGSGWGDDDLGDGGSDALVDAIVAWGDEDAIAERVRAHHDAGADHVCVQVLDQRRHRPPAAAVAPARAAHLLGSLTSHRYP